jgi:hypothetical protein
MTCGATGRLHDLLTALAHPLAADVALDGEDARLVVQLLGHVLADALHGLATAAGCALWFVAHFAARQLRRQLLTPRLLTLACGLGGLQRVDLGSDGRQIGIQRLVQQALLLGAELLALRRELQARRIRQGLVASVQGRGAGASPAWRLTWCPPTLFGGHHPGGRSLGIQDGIAGRLPSEPSPVGALASHGRRRPSDGCRG